MTHHFPFVRQRDAMECGPSCLAMIAEFYGRKPNRDELRTDCALGKAGVSLLGISKAAERLGFHTLGGRLTFEDLNKEGVLPCIVHWRQSHFIVVYRIQQDRHGNWTVYVADPGKGLLTYTREQFTEHWISDIAQGKERGIALLFEPTELFYSGKDVMVPEHNRIAFLWRYLVKYKRFFGQLILGLLLGSLLQLIFPFLTQAIVDTGIGTRDLNFIWLVLIAEMMLLFSRTVIGFIRSKILLHISTRINISLISDFFIKLMKLPMRFFDTKLQGDFLQRIEDHRRVEQFLTSSSLTLLFSFFTFLEAIAQIVVTLQFSFLALFLHLYEPISL